MEVLAQGAGAGVNVARYPEHLVAAWALPYQVRVDAQADLVAQAQEGVWQP